MKIFLDISDLVLFASFSSCVSGIQRVVLSLGIELQSKSNVEFVYLNPTNRCWYTVHGIDMSAQADLKIFDKINTNWRLQRIGGHTFSRMFKSARGYGKFRLLLRFLRSRLLRKCYDGKEVSCGTFSLKPIDFNKEEGVLFIPSIPNANAMPAYRKSLESNQRKVKVAFFVHDIIPVVTPEFAWLEETINFKNYLDLINSTASLVLTSAKYNVKDFVEYIEREYHQKIGYPVEAIGLPVEFNIPFSQKDYNKISPVSRKLKFYRYALVVGSIGPRKNHFEILQAWRKFYESEEYNNEILVVAGSPWASAPDVIQELRKGPYGGSVIFIESPSDIELSYLYEHCLFTICASLYEGWGLPVSESISVGKPVVILNSTTLPEAGFGVANIVENRDLHEMTAMIKRLFTDKDYYEKSRLSVINAKEKLTKWSDFAEKVVKHCSNI